MTTEQIYINGILMEQDGSKTASLVFQSPFFTDIDAIVSNRTNSVDFPATDNNLRAIDNAHLSGSASKFAYRKHRVLYYRNGVQIFSGYATLLSITDTQIKFTFTWGNVNAFKKLLDLKLRDLQTDADYVDWTDAAISSDQHYPTNIVYKTSGYHGTQYVTVGHTHPVLRVSDILARLSAASGVSFVGSSVFDNLAVPILYRNADEYSKTAQGIHLSHNALINLAANQWQHKYVLDCLAADQDLKGQYLGNGVFDVSEYESIRIILKSGSHFRTYHANQSTITPIITGLGVIATDESGANTKLITTIPMNYVRLGDYNTFSVSEDVQKDIDLSWLSSGESGKYNYIQLCVFWYGNAYVSSAAVSGISMDVSIVCGIQEEAQVLFGSKYPLFLNLPDWDASQFLKNLMKLKAVFAHCPDGNTIEFKTIASLYNNRGIALDWTDKLILTNGTDPAEQTPTFGSFAQRNRCDYAEDDTNTQTFNGELIVDNDTLDAESDLIKLDFAGTQYRMSDDSEVLEIHCYSVNPDGDSTEIEEFKEVTPRIVELNSRMASFRNLDWKNLVKSAYYTYQQTIASPKVIKASVLVDALDLQDVDLSIPIYTYALGHYYAINKLTTKDGDVADVELLQLGKLADVIDTPTSEEVTSNLVVERNTDGTYYLNIPSLSGTALQDIISSPDYHIVLMRYGYARRGKWFRYADNTGGYLWSHTSRKTSRTVFNYIDEHGKPAQGGCSSYKIVRKGRRYRIIGETALRKGAEPSSSQQVASHYYDGATLVFELKQTIVLPKMRPVHSNGRSAVITRDGRISNKSTTGLTEIFAVLMHKEGNTWKQASNIVQLRGTNADKTQLWEFETSNFVPVE